MAATEEKIEKVSSVKATPKKTVKKSVATKKEATTITKNADIAYRVLVEPWITEKTHAAIADNKYTFKVIRSATKLEAKKAIEGIYGVKVEKVTVVNIKAKKRAYGRHVGTKSGFKKATVTLKQGDKIEFFQGV